jgi:hypothetical protein
LSILVEHPEETPSRRAGVDAPTERLYRLYGATLIAQAVVLLQPSGSPDDGVATTTTTTSAWPLSLPCTARVIFQRFYHTVSLTECDVWAASMGALWVAAKTQEVALSAKQVIAVYQHLYRRRRLLHSPDAAALWAAHPPRIVAAAHASALSWEDKQAALRRSSAHSSTSLSSVSPLYQDWYKALVDAEGQILRRLGFMLYWIPHDHAHSYLLGFGQALGFVDDNDENDGPLAATLHLLIQHAWNACQDASALDSGVRFDSAVVAVAALSMAASSVGVPWPHDGIRRLLGGSRDKHGNDHQQQAVADCSEFLRDLAADTTTTTQLAAVAFLQPLGPSFNGPGSFLWDMAEGIL